MLMNVPGQTGPSAATGLSMTKYGNGHDEGCMVGSPVSVGDAVGNMVGDTVGEPDGD